MTNQTEVPKQPTAPKLGDDLSAPEIFATDALWFSVNRDSTVHIDFVSERMHHSGESHEVIHVVNLRLVMPTAGAQALAAGLYDFLKNHGLDPVPKPDNSQVQ
jgi:hypothetical protein